MLQKKYCSNDIFFRSLRCLLACDCFRQRVFILSSSKNFSFFFSISGCFPKNSQVLLFICLPLQDIIINVVQRNFVELSVQNHGSRTIQFLYQNGDGDLRNSIFEYIWANFALLFSNHSGGRIVRSLIGMFHSIMYSMFLYWSRYMNDYHFAWHFAFSYAFRLAFRSRFYSLPDFILSQIIPFTSPFMIFFLFNLVSKISSISAESHDKIYVAKLRAFGSR